MNTRDLNEEDMELTVWRYMPFSKFISLIVYQALWFSKLSILQDQFEGRMPVATKEKVQARDQEWKQLIPPTLHPQIDQMASRNEQSSRELLVVSSWFLGNSESERMWRVYGGGKESVAVKSTVKRLVENVGVIQDKCVTHFGRVSYVDYKNHLMTSYHANQGHERAFLKDERFKHEQELRIVTLNIKTKYCVSPEGKPYEGSEVQGKHMNNFENPGLYVAVRLNQLVSEVRTSPEADSWFYLLVKRIMELNNSGINVKRSDLSCA